MRKNRNRKKLGFNNKIKWKNWGFYNWVFIMSLILEAIKYKNQIAQAFQKILRWENLKSYKIWTKLITHWKIPAFFGQHWCLSKYE